jgi:hypothetical protein
VRGSTRKNRSFDHPTRYEIRLNGHLDPRWAAWFDGLDLSVETDGTTLLRGDVADEAALHGLLQRVRDIGLPLIAVTRIAPSEGETAPERTVT